MSDALDAPSHWLAGLPRNPLRPLYRWHIERRTRRALLSLSDVSLKDIGIHRGEIPGLVRERLDLR